jgi:hypothetical protein
MILADVNNYIAVFNYKEVSKEEWDNLRKKNPHHLFKEVSGKYLYAPTKCKGRFEFTDLALHKNKSFLVVPKALYEYFVNGVKPQDYLDTNKNIFDYCGGAKIKGDWFFTAEYIKDGVYYKDKLQKLVRYYVATSGVKLVKSHPDGRDIQLESGKWLQRVFNKFYDCPFDDYQVDKRYYLEQINQEIANIEGSKESRYQTTLF